VVRRLLEPEYPQNKMAWAAKVMNAPSLFPFPQSSDDSLKSILDADQEWHSRLQKSTQSRRMLWHGDRVASSEDYVNAYYSAGKYHLPWVLDREPASRFGLGSDHSFRRIVFLLLKFGHLEKFSAHVQNLLCRREGITDVSLQADIVWGTVLLKFPDIDWRCVTDLAENAVASDPENWSYRGNLGAAHYRAGEFDLAEKELLHAAQLLAKEQGGEWDDANHELAANNISLSFSIHAFRAMTYARLNQPDKARSEQVSMNRIMPSSEYHWQEKQLANEVLRICGPLEPKETP
jgi:tetratricopeptide (TPR) repeat protein